MKNALEQLRMQLIRDYPGDIPTFNNTPVSPEEFAFFFEKTVIPAFQKIEAEFNLFHFDVKIEKFVRTVKIKIQDGCFTFI